MSSTPLPIVTATASFKVQSALGNVRNDASAVKAKGDQETGQALINIQDQIDELVDALQTDIKVSVTTTAGKTGVRTAPVYPWATVDAATPIANPVQCRAPNFGLLQKILRDITGNITPQILVSGRGIVNTFSRTTQAPVIALTTSPTGGFIPGGITYTVGVWAEGQDNEWTPMTLANITVPAGTNTNAIGVTVTFADPAHDKGWVALTPIQAAGWYGPNVSVIPVSGTSYTITTIGDLNTNVPDENFDHFIIEGRTELKSGTAGPTIQAVAGNVLTFDTGLPVGAFVGRQAGILRKTNPLTEPLPIAEVNVTANDATTITVDADMGAIGVEAGDLLFIRFKATTFGPTTIGDALVLTTWYAGPNAWTVDRYKGAFVAIVGGTGAFTRPVPVASNSDHVVQTSAPFDITPDATSVFRILSPTVEWRYPTDRVEFLKSTMNNGIVMPLTVTNDWRTYFIQARTSDAAGNLSDIRYSPFRDIFQLGFPPVLLGEPQAAWEVGFGPGGTPEDIPGGPPPAGTSALFPVEVPGTPYAYGYTVEEAPTGSATTMDLTVYRAGVSIGSWAASTVITIPDGAAIFTRIIVPFADGVELQVGDCIQLSVTGLGSTLPGKRAVIEAWWAEVPQPTESQ